MTVSGLTKNRCSREPGHTLARQDQWQKQISARSFEDRTPWYVNVGLTHQFTPHLSAGLNAGDVTQTSDNPSDEFDENRVSVQLNKFV